MAKALSNKDLFSLIATNTNVSDKTVEKIYNKFIDIIISELQYNEQVVFENFGKFIIEYKGGKDELISNDFGILEKVFVEPKMIPQFIPSKNFIKKINSIDIDRLNKVCEDTVLNYENFILGEKESKNTSDIVDCILNRKQEQIKRKKIKELTGQSKKKGKTIGKPILCLTNNKIYPSLRQASFDLDLSIENIKKSIDKDTDTFGYKFKYLTQEEYENKIELIRK